MCTGKCIHRYNTGVVFEVAATIRILTNSMNGQMIYLKDCCKQIKDTQVEKLSTLLPRAKEISLHPKKEWFYMIMNKT